jgi:hypothetical protein
MTFAQIAFSEAAEALRQSKEGCWRGAALIEKDNKAETSRTEMQITIEMK